MPRVTQRDVVVATIEQIDKRGGFITSDYFKTRPSGETLFYPGPSVGATCAVGGVEQAIWRLTGETIHHHTYKNAQQPIKGNLFANVMARLNRKTKELYGDLSFNDEPVETIEHLTFVGGDRIARERVLFVLRAVLADLDKQSQKRSQKGKQKGKLAVAVSTP